MWIINSADGTFVKILLLLLIIVSLKILYTPDYEKGYAYQFTGIMSQISSMSSTNDRLFLRSCRRNSDKIPFVS